jgi:hypothetical protein
MLGAAHLQFLTELHRLDTSGTGGVQQKGCQEKDLT